MSQVREPVNACRCGHRLTTHMLAGELCTGPCRATGCRCPNPAPAPKFEPCERAPIGIVTNCAVMDCEGRGCALAAAEARPPGSVSLDDLVAPAAPRSPFSSPTGADAVAYGRAIAALLAESDNPRGRSGWRRWFR